MFSQLRAAGKAAGGLWSITTGKATTRTMI
jgi:hypothetical protein